MFGKNTSRLKIEETSRVKWLGSSKKCLRLELVVVEEYSGFGNSITKCISPSKFSPIKSFTNRLGVTCYIFSLMHVFSLVLSTNRLLNLLSPDDIRQDH